MVIKRRADAYGNTLIFTGPGADSVWFTDDDTQSTYGANETIYCGYRYDPETELYYVRNRTYNSVLGRWLQRDLVGYADGVNFYQYVSCRPMGNLDLMGLKAKQFAVVAKSFIAFPIVAGSFGWWDPEADLALRAFAKFTEASFQEDPRSSRMSGRNYRLFTKAVLKVDCGCKTKSGGPTLKLIYTAEDGGAEPLGFHGTINMSKVKIKDGQGFTTFSWMGWGHPDSRIEEAFQLVHPRLSVNIWREVKGSATCKSGHPDLVAWFEAASAFPSHRLWVNGGKWKAQLLQEAFVNLWMSAAFNPTFVRSR